VDTPDGWGKPPEDGSKSQDIGTVERRARRVENRVRVGMVGGQILEAAVAVAVAVAVAAGEWEVV